MSLQSAFDHIDQYAEQLIETTQTPGLAIAITDRERLIRVSTYGVSDIVAQIPITSGTLFEIGSLGKPFTSIALLQLRDEGKLDLQAPVSDYLPWFEVQSDYGPIAIHHLLNHTSGIIRGTDVSPYGLYESWALRQTQTRTAPGTYFWYSNLGYKTLGFLLEELAGQSFPDVIQSRVLTPLGMTQSYPVIIQESREDTATGHCGFYDDRPDHPSHGLVPAIWAEYGTGDGCQVSTASDMAKYLRMLLNRGQTPNGRLLSDESFNLLTTGAIWTGGDFYGYGLASYPVDDRTYIGHGGGNAGFRSAIVVDLEAGLGVVCLLNLWGYTDPIVDAATHILNVMRSAQSGGSLPALPPGREATQVDNAADYVGVYRWGQQSLHLTSEDGQLLLTYNNHTVALEARGDDRFYAGHPTLDLFLLEFRRQDGAIVEVLHGPNWYIHDRYTGPVQFDYPEAWTSYTGHYRARNSEASNFRVVLRKGNLDLIFPWGTVESLMPLADGSFRVGADEYSPETIKFGALAGRRALLAEYSGCPYYRTFTP